jgi:hypothetical protein
MSFSWEMSGVYFRGRWNVRQNAYFLFDGGIYYVGKKTFWPLNALKHEFNVKFSSYLTENTTRLHYNDKLVNGI